MRKRTSGWRFGLVGAGVILFLAVGAGVAWPWFPGSPWHHAVLPPTLPRAEVRRTDLTVSLTTAGRIDSSNRTTIECQLEALDVGVRGTRIVAGGASTILSVIPDGSTVKEGDVLCVLDSSDYEELLRTQRMNVDRAQADHRQAELGLDVAKTAVTEYRDGLMQQNIKSMEGQIALSQSDFERANQRLAWTRQMVAKGYLPRSQVTTEEFLAKQMAHGLMKGRTNLRLFRQWFAPVYLKVLESEIKSAEAVLNYQDRRLARNQERLQYLERQVARCTIKAPHDGFVIYANEEMRNVRIEPGLAVRQKQRLFYLPDLTKMEVAALLHESVVKEVKPGMLARVKVEGLSDRQLEGHVVAVSQLPMQREPWFSDIKYFVATVKLDTIPVGLKPGMSAEVAIRTVRRPDVLAVPYEAVTVEDGHDVCYVTRDDHLERREVRVGQATRDMIEVTGGLEEGDEVVLDPTTLDGSLTVTDAPNVLPVEPQPEESQPATD
jgi:HlyD family secretion protein